MRVPGSYWWPVLLIAVLAACSDSSSSPPVEEGGLKEGEVCKFAGEVSCGVDVADIAAVLVCEVTEEFGRVWILKESCEWGCQDEVCLPPDLPDGTEYVPEPDLKEPDVPDIPPCDPECEGKICGDDGCGGLCGECPTDHKCIDGEECVLHCEPKCEGKQCGDDGCGGSCGECPFAMQCQAGLCECSPKCQDKECGSDGCGGTCGECAVGFQCSPFGKCEPPCEPACEGKSCGDDGCGGVCGNCPCPDCEPWDIYCTEDGQCTDICPPQCDGKECGPDSCGGQCGVCPCPECPDEFTMCDPEGLCVKPLSCLDIMICLGGCVPTDEPCILACFDAGSFESQMLYYDLVICVIDECGDVPSVACQTEARSPGGVCADEQDACLNDP